MKSFRVKPSAWLTMGWQCEGLSLMEGPCVVEFHSVDLFILINQMNCCVIAVVSGGGGRDYD